MNDLGHRILVLALATTVFYAPIVGNAGESEESHHLSYGPLRSENYFWVPSNRPDAEHHSELQNSAIRHLVECRKIQDEKYGDRLVLLSTAEEDIRVCMLERGWSRKWTVPLVIY